MTKPSKQYQALGDLFARQIDETRLASNQRPPVCDARLTSAVRKLRLHADATTISVRGGEVVILAQGGRVDQIIHRTSQKGGTHRVAGGVHVDAGALRSNRPEAWARALVEFAVSSMGGAA